MDIATSTQSNSATTPGLSPEDINLPLSALIPVVIIYGTLIATTVLGNLLVIISYAQDRKLQQRPANLIIVNLAVADFLVGLVSLPFNLTTVVSGRWLFGEYCCKLYGAIDYLVVYMSVVMIVYISFDRYWLVTKPIKHRSIVTRKRVRSAIIPVWVIYSTFCFLLSFGWTPFGGEMETVDYSHECQMEYLANPIATLSVSVVTFLLPFMSVVYLNFHIFLSIRRQSNRFRMTYRKHKETIKFTVNQSTNRQKYIRKIPGVEGNSRCSRSQRELDSSFQIQNISKTVHLKETPSTTFIHCSRSRLQKKVKIAQKLALLVVVFGASWLPFEICTIVSAFCREICVSDLVWDIAENILWVNSAINPVLYAFTNVQFRRNFRRLIRCSQKVV